MLFVSLPDKTNKESVRTIEKSICTICLDAPMPRVSDDIYKSRVAAQMLHGGGSRWNSGNRWFDKTLQVSADGLSVLDELLCHENTTVQEITENFRRRFFLISRERREKQERQSVVGDSVRSYGFPCSHHKRSFLPQGLLFLLLPLPTLIQCSSSLCSL